VLRWPFHILHGSGFLIGNLPHQEDEKIGASGVKSHSAVRRKIAFAGEAGG
jgi:hypothetical protein